MGNWIYAQLEVLASNDGISRIGAALEEPCERLIIWAATEWMKDPKEISADVKRIVAFKPSDSTGRPFPSKSGRFEHSWKDRWWDVVLKHLSYVSREFPEAVFLLSYQEPFRSYAGKFVICGGREIRHVHDSHQRGQGWEWVLPNIFAPYKSEYYSEYDFGSLWGHWLIGMEGAIAELRERYGASTRGGAEATFERAAEWVELECTISPLDVEDVVDGDLTEPIDKRKEFERAAEFMEQEQIAEEEG
jgi:hypothetical protein